MSKGLAMFHYKGTKSGRGVSRDYFKEGLLFVEHVIKNRTTNKLNFYIFCKFVKII